MDADALRMRHLATVKSFCAPRSPFSVDRDADEDQADIDAAWDEAIDRRVKGIVSGEAPLVDGREAHAQVRSEIAALRK